MAGTDYGFKAKDRAKVSAENREAFIQQVNSQYEQKQEAARTKSDTDLLSGVNAGKVTNNQNAIRSGTTTKPTRTVGKESTTPLKSAGSKGNTAAATWENGKGPNPKAALAAQAEKANQRRKANISRLGKDSTIGRDLGYTRDRDLAAVTITPAQRLNSLANNINQSEKQLTEWGLQLNRLQAAAQNGTSGAASKYNALAEKYNATFEQYAADIEAYNKLYNGEFRDSAVRGKYAQREYMQQRQANRDLGARRSYQQRLNEEEARAPQETTLRRKGASVGEHSYKRITGEGPQEAGYTFTYEPTRLQQWGRAIHNSYVGNMKAAAGAFYRNSIPEGGSVSGMNSEIGVNDQTKAAMQYWSNELLHSGREQSNLGTYQTKLASQGLGTFGTFIVDASIAGVQMLMDMGISVVTGGSMLPAMFVRSMGGGYLTAEQMGASDEEALAYGIGVGAVEALSEKMFSVFSIGNRFAKGAVNKEMSERIIDRLLKNMTLTLKGKTALNRLFTILFATGSEGLEEVAAGIMEPVIRKFTMDPELDVKSEIDWQEALYEGLIGGLLGGIGGAVDLVNTKGTYWKYYKEGLTEGIDRYVATAKKYGIGSEEALQAAKDIWTAGNEKLNGVAGFIVGANEDGTGGEWVPLIEATQETIDNGLPVTFHQVVAQDALNNYEYGVKDYGIVTSQDLNLRNYLTREENARKEAENQRLEAARREEAPTIDQAQPGQGGEFPGSTNRRDVGPSGQVRPSSPQGELTETSRDSTSDEGIVRLDTARSAQTRAQAPEGAADLSGIPEEEMTQEEKDELQYGSGAVEDLGQYTGLAQRMGAPVAGRSSARVASSPAANVERTGNEDITRRVNDLAGRLQSKGLQSVERIKADPRMDGMRVGDVIFINERLSGAAAEAATMGHEVVHFAGDFDAQLINDLIAAMRRQGRDIDGLVETKREIYRKQFAEMGQAWDEEQMNQAYFEEEVAADFIGEICRADSETLDRIAAEEPGLIRRIINALRQLLARITGNQQAVYEQAIDRLNAALEKVGQNENAVRADGGIRYELSDRLDIPEVPAGTIPATADEALNMDITDARNIARYNNEIKSIMDGTMPPRQMLLIGRPPEIIQKYMNGSGNPLYMPQTSVKKTIYPAGVNGGKHGLGEKVMQGLPYQFSEPLAITGNTTQHENYGDNSIVVWTDWLTDAGDPVIIPIRIDVNGYVGVYNNVNTVFNVHNEEYLNDLLRDGNILYTKNNEDIHALLDSLWRQVPQVPTTEDTLYDSSIAEREGNVNSDQATPEADLQATIQQLTDQMTKLTEMLSERTGEAPAVAAGNDQDADYQTAVENGDMETARRMVEEAAKAAGYDMHLYHGAKKGGGFTVFRDWQYFTENKKYAERYQQRDNDDSLYEVYAKSGRMFDTRKADDKAVYDQYSREYGMGELQESGLPDWTDGYDLSEMIEENELDYDGVILDEGGDLVDGEPVSRGPSYILRKSNQVKSAEPVTYDDDGEIIPLSQRFDLSKEDIRFSLNDTVETKGNLVALHNLNAEKLGKALDLGGFPMPSIAVTKADIPHTNFGDITLVMDKSTVDPKANRKNEVYSADAWTPTFPQTEYEADEKVQSRLRRKFSDLESRFGRQQVDALYSYGTNLEYELDRNGGVAGILERERDNDRMKQVYMLDAGLELPEPGIKKTTTRMDDASIAMNEYFLRALGESTVREITPQDEESPMTARKRWWGDHGEEMEEAYRGYLRQPQFGLSEDEIGNVMDQMRVADFTRMVLQARHYLNNGPETVKEEPDYTARDKAIANVDQAAYEAWLDDLFAGAEKNSGIYNGKDRYTASGNQRSFASTHYDVTLENIARAMAAENDGNSKNVGGFYGVKTLRGGTAVTFRSIPEMHELEDRLQHLTEEEAEQLNEALQNRLIEVLGKIDGQRSYGSSEDNAFMRMDSIGYIMEEIAETGSWPAEKVQRIFGKYSYDLSPEMGQEVSDLLTDIQQMPVNIFEAKPKRVVRFDEVRAAIVPDSTDQALIDRLHEAGVEDVRTYEDGNDASRLEQVNAVPNVRFSLNDDPELERARQQAEYWKQLALKNSGVKDVDKLTRDLMRGYGSRASRSEMSGRMRELEEFLRSGGSEAEARATARQMAEDMLNKAAVPEDAADSEYHAAFRRYFRTNSISVPEEVKRGWPDGWGRFRKRYFGRLNLKNDGMDVTKIYREASQQWPDLLPSDEVVMRAQDQLETIAEVLDNLEPNMVNPYGSGPEFDAAVDSLAEDIISSLTRTEEERPKEDTRLQRTEAETEELRQELGIEPETSEEMTPAELMAARKKAEGAKRYLQKTQRRMNLTQQESELVDALIRGTLTEDQLPPGIDRQGVLAVCRAKQTYLDAMAPVDEYNRQRRERNFTLAEQLIENSDEWKDMKNGFAYARETARRIFYGLTKNTEEAQALIDTYVETIRKNEAAKNRMINEYNERIKKLGIDTKTKAGNKVSEAYAVQFVGEAEFMLGWLEQLPEGTTRDGLTYGEVKMLLDEFWRDNPNLDQDRIHAAVAEFRGIYDELFAMVNEARVLNGYAPIDYRKGYFPHFTSDQGDNIIQSLARGMGIGVEVTELPTSIAGTTHLFRPGIQWSGHMLRRTGSTTDYNVLEGWDRYIPAVANIIYHTEDIQKLRALETVIRRKYSDTTVQDEIDATRRSKDMTAEEINAKLDELFKRDTTQLNYFVQWLREYTNQLAGKKAELDRNVEKFVGRKVYRIVQKLENRVAANMLGGNISSAMTNFVPLFQAWGNVSTASMMRAMWDTGVGAIRGNGWRDGSSFLVNRKGYDAMYQTLFGKVKNALFAPFNWVDDFVSETVVRARYYDELRRGLSPEAAMVEADAFAGGVMADRAIGELPTIFNSKNPLVKVFTMFQVEVNNDLSHLLKDIPKDARDKGLAALFASVLKYMLGVYMFNDLFEWLFGRRVSIDPLSMLNDLAGDATGYELPNMFESAVLIAKGEWQGWEEFENGKGGDFFSDLVGDLKEWLDDVPFISGLLGGGRFPIQAMLPEEGAVKAGYDALRDILKPEKDQENPDAYDWNKIYKTVKNPLYYWAMPAFGGQMRKIAEGIYAYTQHGSYSQTKQGRVLQYPILDYGDLVKAMVFGKTTTRYGKEWIESDFDSLTAPQTEAYIDLVSGGSDPELIYQILHDLKGTERTAAEKAYALASANLDDGERIALFSALDRDEEAQNFADLMGAGLTFRQCADVLDEYRRLKNLEDQTAKGDEGTSERRRLSTEFSIFLGDQGFDDKTVDAVQEIYDMQVKPIRYDWLTAAGIHREGAMELALDWSELEPPPGKNSATWLQKVGAVADAGYLSEGEKHLAVKALQSSDKDSAGQSRQDKYQQYIIDYGTPVEVYYDYTRYTDGLTGDDLDGDGKNDAFTKIDKKLAIINRLPLQPGQKTALAIFDRENVSEKTIYNRAPWL